MDCVRGQVSLLSSGSKSLDERRRVALEAGGHNMPNTGDRSSTNSATNLIQRIDSGSLSLQREQIDNMRKKACMLFGVMMTAVFIFAVIVRAVVALTINSESERNFKENVLGNSAAAAYGAIDGGESYKEMGEEQHLLPDIHAEGKGTNNEQADFMAAVKAAVRNITSSNVMKMY